MHDIKFIRDNPEVFNNEMSRRKADFDGHFIIQIDNELRDLQTKTQSLLTERNEVTRSISKLKSRNEDASKFLARANQIKQELPENESKIEELKIKLNEILISIPNILANDVAEGNDENDNVEIKKHGDIRSFDFKVKEHFDLGEDLQMMDFKQAAKVSGARFVYLKSSLALLERALANFMLDINTNKFEYIEVSPPYLVKSNAVFGVGQLPKFEQDLFKTNSDHYLISTSEASLTNLVADSIIAEQELPLRFTAYTPCFRSEAGSSGKDTKGMIRLHQFSKVELVSITKPQDSNFEHERMLSIVETLLQMLELPYRIVKLCSADTSFSSSKTYDIEAWLPGQNLYREISSCSNCGDFQARRLKARYKSFMDSKNYFVHTLNSSALPIGRTIVAIIENYQNNDGSITIPEVLVKYMNGLKRIG